MKNSQNAKEPNGEQMTLFLSAVSHASPTAKPESDLGRKTSDTSGRRCSESFQKLSQPTSWAKMFMALLIGQTDWSSKKCVLTWKIKATRFNRYYFQLQASVRHTKETEFGLLPTPLTHDSHSPRTWNGLQKRHTWELTDMAFHGLLPTPVAGEYRDTGEKVKGNNYKQKNLTRTIANNSEEWAGSNSQLSPQFVLEMMGFPTDWTVLPFLNGETNPSKPLEMR